MASEEFATVNQIKRLYAVLHSTGRDPKEFKKVRGFSSYEKLTREQCSAFITELEMIEKQREAIKEQDLETGVQKQIPKEQLWKQEPVPSEADVRAEQAADLDRRDAEVQLEEAHAEAEVSRMGLVMKFCVLEAKRIADELCNHGGITEGTKASMVQKLGTTMFIEAMSRGL